jgi:phosphate transport system substrate-binding protein
MQCARRLLLATPLAALLACGSPAPSTPIVIDGSSTLEPLTQAVAADFTKSHRTMPVQVGGAGTDEGFPRFCKGELDILDASRPATAADQRACDAGHVSFIELPVAQDAITIIVNPANTWATSITLSELGKIWAPAAEHSVTRWNQVRAGWPDRPIALFGPGTESGTFDYFTAAVTGAVDASRKDYTASGDDKVIVEGVGANENALGYVGYSYFDRNRKMLKALAVDNGDTGGRAVEPSAENVARGVYRPLARPLFIYLNQPRLQRPEVKAFVDHYLRHARELAAGVGEVPLMATAYDLTQQRFAKGITGTMYKTAEDARQGIELLLTQ